MSPAGIAIVRWTSFAIVLFAALSTPWFRRLTNARWPSKRDAITAVCTGALLWAPSHLLYYSALGKTSTVEGTVLNTTSPIWTAALAFLFLRERADKNRLLALFVGFAGSWIVIVGFRLPEMAAGHTTGNMLYVLGALIEAAAGVVAVSVIRRSSGITVLALQVVGAIATYCIAPLLLPHQLPVVIHPGTVAIGSLAYLVLFPGLLCFGVWYRLVEFAPLSLIVVSLLLQSPLSALLGYFALGERLTTELAIGSLLIFSALIIGSLDRGRSQTLEMADN